MAKDRMRKQYERDFYKQKRMAYVDQEFRSNVRKEGARIIPEESKKERFTPDTYGRKSY